MAQRIQAPLNVGLCLIISREGISTVPRKRRWREFNTDYGEEKAQEETKLLK